MPASDRRSATAAGAATEAAPEATAGTAPEAADETVAGTAHGAAGHPSAESVEERLTTLELKLMDAERTLEALDAVILRQARDIEGLRTERARLEARLESLAEGLGETPSPDDERPPHY